MHRPDDVRLSRSPAPPHPQEHLELQLDWDVVRLHGRWSTGPDNDYVMDRLSTVPSEVTAHGEPRRVLEVAAAEAIHSCKLSLRGIECFVIEPSPAMLDRARARIAEHGARVALVRGIAETLPFADQTFSSALAILVLHHLNTAQLQDRLFAECFRVLGPGGVFLAFDIPDGWLHRMAHIRSTFTPIDPVTVSARLASAGFVRSRVEIRNGGFLLTAMRS